MRAVVQRVSSAAVTVDDRTVGQIARGVLALVGVEQGDGPADAQYIAGKIRDLRIFDDPSDSARRMRSRMSLGTEQPGTS